MDAEPNTGCHFLFTTLKCFFSFHVFAFCQKYVSIFVCFFIYVILTSYFILVILEQSVVVVVI